MSPPFHYHILFPGGSPIDKGSPSIIISENNVARPFAAPGRRMGGAARPGRPG
jgi:hypothetical protein